MSYLLYDLDGTLVESSKQITNDMIDILVYLQNQGHKNILITGGQYSKVKHQLKNRTDLFYMIFTECGSVLHQNNQEIYKHNIINDIDTTLLKNIYREFIEISKNINFQGNRIDERNGLIYLTPVGMNANDDLRSDFIRYDTENNFRFHLIEKLKSLDTENKIEIVKGGKTGVSVYPRGVDKTQILPHIPKDKTIYFFGDNCQKGGNDYPLYINPICVGYEVVDYKHTINLLKKLFMYL